ncbi:hypothetical protein AKJ48_02720 [candidate division MSBL1 archaeon SCGC-AAA261O19]|uniref:Uncharacterized protein n=1 Tax=candidate division MSBL1 archaeon SCGC-AAA261O19 TaxID=1698277 RepID=A0A133VD87_9EURY|nr:hypothetical protein AKJ48_02720 [candidate division MSBL1 archaeon SCGC-AAA261O19]
MNFIFIISLAILALVILWIQRDAQRRGIERKVYWLWLFLIIPAFLFLRIIGVGIVLIAYYLSSRRFGGE